DSTKRRLEGDRIATREVRDVVRIVLPIVTKRQAGPAGAAEGVRVAAHECGSRHRPHGRAGLRQRERHRPVVFRPASNYRLVAAVQINSGLGTGTRAKDVGAQVGYFKWLRSARGDQMQIW